MANSAPQRSAMPSQQILNRATAAFGAGALFWGYGMAMIATKIVTAWASGDLAALTFDWWETFVVGFAFAGPASLAIPKVRHAAKPDPASLASDGEESMAVPSARGRRA